MKRNFRTLVLLCLLSLVLVLAACGKGDAGHTHAFGEWETVKEATVSEDGLKQRVCTCGDKETQAIPHEDVAFAKAVSLIEEKKYAEAYDILTQIKGYADADTELAKFFRLPTLITNTEIENGVSSVFSTTEFSYDLIERSFKMEDKWSDGESYVLETVFDENGKVVKRVATYPDGITTWYLFSYNKDGKLIKEEAVNSDGKKSLAENFYGEDGYIEKREFTDFSGNKTVMLFTHDEKGNLIKEESVYGSADKTTIEYTYDENGNRTSMTYLYSNGDKTVYTYTYDANGNLVKEIYAPHYDSETVCEYFYDAEGRMIKEIITYGGEAKVSEFTYNADGKVTKVEYSNADGTKDSCEVFYGEDGKLEKVHYVYSEGSDKTDDIYEIVYGMFYFEDEALDDMFYEIVMEAVNLSY